MTLISIQNIAALLEDLRRASYEARHDRIFTAVIDSGGCWTGPKASLVEINLLGISASGADDNEAINNWMNIASNRVKADGVAA